jgi:hypothetical protein
LDIQQTTLRLFWTTWADICCYLRSSETLDRATPKTTASAEKEIGRKTFVQIPQLEFTPNFQNFKRKARCAKDPKIAYKAY